MPYTHAVHTCTRSDVFVKGFVKDRALLLCFWLLGKSVAAMAVHPVACRGRRAHTHTHKCFAVVTSRVHVALLVCQIVRMTCTALVVTAVVFMEIFACVMPNDDGKGSWVLLTILVPLFLTPVPLLLLRCCGAGDSFSSGPKARHCARRHCMRVRVRHAACR